MSLSKDNPQATEHIFLRLKKAHKALRLERKETSDFLSENKRWIPSKDSYGKVVYSESYDKSNDIANYALIVFIGHQIPPVGLKLEYNFISNLSMILKICAWAPQRLHAELQPQFKKLELDDDIVRTAPILSESTTSLFK